MKRVLLAILVISAAPLGLWATLAPRSFYDNFPGMGRHWVAIDGPYNHHLVSDFGALNLALCAVTIVALVTLQRTIVRTTAVAWLLYAIPHELYHATHIPDFGMGDKIAQLSGLAIDIVVAIALLIITATDASDGAVTSDTAKGRANSS